MNYTWAWGITGGEEAITPMDPMDPMDPVTPSPPVAPAWNGLRWLGLPWGQEILSCLDCLKAGLCCFVGRGLGLHGGGLGCLGVACGSLGGLRMAWGGLGCLGGRKV